MATNIIFPHKKDNTLEQYDDTTFKWQQGNTKNEIHAHTLENLDIEDLLPHGLEVKTKVTKEVHNNAHLGPAFFKVFPRTLSLPLAAIWDQLVVNYTNDDHTEANFDHKLREFIAYHATDQDHHELVQQLLHPMKPHREEGVSGVNVI
jgi:hypothetical protein